MITRLDEFLKRHLYLRRGFFSFFIMWPLLYWITADNYVITDITWFRRSFINTFLEISDKAVFCLIAYISSCLLLVASFSAVYMETNGQSPAKKIIDLMSKQSFGFKVILVGLSPIVILIISFPVSFLKNWGAGNITFYGISIILIGLASIVIFLIENIKIAQRTTFARNSTMVAIGILMIFLYLRPSTWQDYYDEIVTIVNDYIRKPTEEGLRSIDKVFDNANKDRANFDIDFMKERIVGAVVPVCGPQAMQQFGIITGMKIDNVDIKVDTNIINHVYEAEYLSRMQDVCVGDVSTEYFIKEALSLKYLIVHLCGTKRIMCY